MYKVLIVDDDVLIRNNLKYLLSQMNGEFVCCAEAGNGQEALGLLESLGPDIILLDMEMPVMNGVELSRRMAERYPQIPIIILSNYDDYKYVHSAFRYGAKDYILKHTIEIHILLNALREAAQTLKKRNVGQDSDYMINHSNIQSLKRKYMIHLLTGTSLNRKAMEAGGRFLNLKLYEQHMLPVIMLINNYELVLRDRAIKEIALLEFSIINICNEIIENSYSDQSSILIAHIENERFCILFTYKKAFSESSLKNAVLNMLDKIQKALHKFTNLSIHYIWGSWCHSYGEIPVSYQRIEQISIARTPQSEEMHVKSGQSGMSHRLTGIEKKAEVNIEEALISNDPGTLKNMLRQVFTDIKEKKMDVISSQIIYTELFSIMSKLCKEKMIQIDQICQDSKMLNAVLSCTVPLQETHDWFLEKMILLADVLEGSSGKSQSFLVKRAVQIIKNRFADDITLQSVAEELEVSTGYLCTLFKHETCDNFSGVLRKTKVEQAKRLLRSGNRDFKEVARKSGFQNYQYFFSVFKKEVGITPLDYLGKHTD